MIHVVIPSTQTLVERTDGVSKYTAFNLHINGWFHASVRFSLLHRFAETIKFKFGHNHNLPEFPPKKFFGRVEGVQLDERRQRIAQYLQHLVQKTEIVKSSIVEQNFLEFQLDSYRPTSNSVTVEVHLGDGTKLCVKCSVLLPTRDVIKVFSDELQADFSLLYQCFGLFMVQSRSESHCEFNVMPVRQLCNFESPYVSLQLANHRASTKGFFYKLQLRRMVWDPRTQEKILYDKSIVNLLFKQAKKEWELRSFVADTMEGKESLEALAKSENAERFLRVCCQQSGYGYEELGVSQCQLGDGERTCVIRVGRRQLLLTQEGTGNENIFRATRIRIWRISQPPSMVDHLIFQFEYLISKSNFEWITLHTEHAILLSLLLQSIGTEILNELKENAREAALSSVADLVIGDGEKRHKRPGATSIGEAFPPKVDLFREVDAQKASPVSISSHSSNSSFHSNSNVPAPKLEVFQSIQEVFASPCDTLSTHNHTFGINITDDDL